MKRIFEQAVHPLTPSDAFFERKIREVELRSEVEALTGVTNSKQQDRNRNCDTNVDLRTGMFKAKEQPFGVPMPKTLLRFVCILRP